MTKIQKSNYEKKTQKHKMQPNLKKKNTNCYQTQKLQLWQNSFYEKKTLKEYFSKKNLATGQSMRGTLGAAFCDLQGIYYSTFLPLK